MSTKISRRSFLKATAAGALGVAATAAIGPQPAKALAEEEANKPAYKPAVPGVAGVINRATMPKLAWDDPSVALKVRWNGVNFYEFALPDGTAIVMDPYWDKSAPGGHNEYNYTPTDLPGGEWVRGCDYVVLTHAHGDHVDELDTVLQKYPCAQIIMPEHAWPSVTVSQHVKSKYVSTAGAHDLFQLHGFTLETCRSNHNWSALPQNEEYADDKWNDADGKFDFWALYKYLFEREIMNMKITTDNGFTILIWNSEMQPDGFGYETRPYFYQNACPDLFMYQVAGASFNYDRRNPVTDHMANWIASVKGKAALPEHQQHFSYDELDAMAEKFAVVCNEQNVGTQFLTPETGIWYGYVKNQDGTVTTVLLENP